MQLYSVLLPLCLCTAVGAVWLYNRVGQSICGVVRKHVLGYETPEEEEGRHCSAASRSKFADYVSEIIYEILTVGTFHSAQ